MLHVISEGINQSINNFIRVSKLLAGHKWPTNWASAIHTLQIVSVVVVAFVAPDPAVARGFHFASAFVFS